MNFSWLFLFNLWDNALAAVSLLVAVYLIVGLLKPDNLLETVLFSFCVASALIVVWGYALAAFDKLADLSAWALLAAGSGVMAAVFFFRLKTRFVPLHTQTRAAATRLAQWYANETSRYEKILFAPLCLTALFVALFNLALALFTAPHAWDSLTYHLPRMSYYLQQGNYAFFGANYWAQVIHPKNSVSVLIYAFLVAGRNDNFTQLTEYVAHWVFVLAVYGISRKAGFNRSQGVFSALVGSLLIIGVILAVSAQNDIFIAACFGVTIYSLFAFRHNPRSAYLLTGGAGIALALGAKSSTLLALPSVALIALYVFIGADKRASAKNILRFGLALLACGFFLTLPAGYVENLRRFGHPVGPLKVRQMHSFEGQSGAYVLRGGAYNALRFGFDFLSFDGLPRGDAVKDAQAALRFLPRKALAFLNIDLESDFAVGFSPFNFELDRAVNWGALGFGLIWIAVILALVRVAGHKDAFMLALAAALFFAAQAFAGPYDAARGRYFMICAVFAAPVSGLWLNARSRLIRAYLFLILLVGCVSAIYAAAESAPLFEMDRNRQFAFTDPQYYQRLKPFDFAVPQDAVVAVYLYPNAFEYPLFGKALTRTLLPLNSFAQGLQPIPAAAEYLLYAKGYPCPDARDKHLSRDWFLRKLDATNRACEIPAAP